MPVRLNSYYNDPSIGQAVGNLAAAFAPPDGTQLYAGQKAQGEAWKNSRLAELYAMAGRPDVDQSVLDRQAALAGAYNPNQSLTAVGMNNDTTLKTNAADNARAIQQTRLQQQGDTTRTLLAPLSEGQVRHAPPGVAQFYNIPEQQIGGVKLSAGQNFTFPGGQTIEGPEAPETESTIKARVLGGMPIEQQRAVVFGSTPIDPVVGPDGKPLNVTRLGAIGQQPAAKPADVAPTNVAKLQAERAALQPGDPRAAELTAAIDAAGRGQTTDTFKQTSDQLAAKNYETLATDGQKARGFQSDVDMLGTLLSDAPTGIAAPARLKAAQYAQGLGLPDVAAGLTGGKMDTLTAANAIVQRLAPSLRVPGSGAQSDRELGNFLASLPSISTQPGGNKIILDTLRGGAAYKQQVGEIANRALRGEIDRATADAQIAAVPTPFSAYSASRAEPTAASGGAPAPGTGAGEGTIIQNDAGVRMVRRGGKWEPM